MVNLDLQLVKKKMRLNQLAELTGISVPNLSKLKTGKARAVRFSTLEKICRDVAAVRLCPHNALVRGVAGC